MHYLYGVDYQYADLEENTVIVGELLDKDDYIVVTLVTSIK